MNIGRILVHVPDALDGNPSTWATPCFPFAGHLNGFFAVPAVNSGVWIEFEQGDSDYPIWTGCFFGNASEVPAPALSGTPGLQNVVIQTAGMNMLMLSDTPGPTGGIVLKSKSGAMISISDTGIVIDNGQGASINLSGPSVSINQGALAVT